MNRMRVKLMDSIQFTEAESEFFVQEAIRIATLIFHLKRPKVSLELFLFEFCEVCKGEMF